MHNCDKEPYGTILEITPASTLRLEAKSIRPGMKSRYEVPGFLRIG